MPRQTRYQVEPGALYVAAAHAAHAAHCAGCRELDAAMAAAAAENGESVARRDRRQLGLDRRALRVRGW
jgi:hypothetical protein